MGIYCKKCHYDLRSLGQKQSCPECGYAFDPQDEQSFLSQIPTLQTKVGKRLAKCLWWNARVFWTCLGLEVLLGLAIVLIRQRFLHVWAQYIPESLVIVPMSIVLWVGLLSALVSSICFLAAMFSLKDIKDIPSLWFPVGIVASLFVIGAVMPNLINPKSDWNAHANQMRTAVLMHTESQCPGKLQSWQYEHLLSWMENAVEYQWELDSLEHLHKYDVRLVFADDKKVIYRFLGRDGIDDGNLWDDRQVALNLSGTDTAGACRKCIDHLK